MLRLRLFSTDLVVPNDIHLDNQEMCMRYGASSVTHFVDKHPVRDCLLTRPSLQAPAAAVIIGVVYRVVVLVLAVFPHNADPSVLSHGMQSRGNREMNTLGLCLIGYCWS